jgi:predicted nucleic acid-binding protein
LNPPEAVICDTTLLSNFARVDRLDLLPRGLGRPIFTTVQVVDEIGAGVRAGYKHLAELEARLLAGAGSFPILELASAELTTFSDLRLRLHAGEASCLAIALHRGFILGTDDLAARRMAQARNVSVIGTVGVPILCRHSVLLLDEANAILQDLIAAGYRSPISSLDDLWR